MFGATFLVPVLTGFPPTTTLFFSAISTMLFLLITRNKVPSYLGSSFAFISPVVAASTGSIGAACFGIACTGVLLAIIGLIVMRAGTVWINKLMPPVVTGVIVALIGFNLAPTAYANFMAQPLLATITFVTIVLVQALSKGLVGRLAILIGVVVGYIAAALMNEISFESVAQADWIGLPTFHLPEVDPGVLLMFLPVVLVLVAENIGHVKSVATMTGKNLDKYMGRALFSDGLGTTLAGLGGGSGTTTYAENIGVMAATRVYSTAAYWVAGAGALVLSLCPKFGAAIFLIPSGVLGGVCILLYGMIGMLGVRIWVENKVDFSNNVNMVTGAVPLVMGIASFTLAVGGASVFNVVAGDYQAQPSEIIIGPIAVASVMALILYHLMIALNKARGIELPKPVNFNKIEAGEDAAAAEDAQDVYIEEVVEVVETDEEP
jgi:uracil-xanthine permease